MGLCIDGRMHTFIVLHALKEVCGNYLEVCIILIYICVCVCVCVCV
jgi:hypothetical protein